MPANLRRSAVPAVLVLVAIYAALAMPQSQSKQGQSAQKKQAPAKDDSAAKPDTPPKEEPAPADPLFRTTVKSTGTQSGGNKALQASAGFNGVNPATGQVDTTKLAQAPTAQDKQAALILSTLVMPDSEIDKFIAEGKLNPAPAAPPAKGGK